MQQHKGEHCGRSGGYSRQVADISSADWQAGCVRNGRRARGVASAPAAAATLPLIQNVNKADAKPKSTLKGRKHHIKRGVDCCTPSAPPPLPSPMLLLLLLAVKRS